MTKPSIVRLLAVALLLVSGSVGILAQRGQGKGEGPGLGFPTMTARGGDKRDTGKTPAAASSRSPHMPGSPKMSASTALANNAALAALVTPLLPAGQTLAAASAGFSNVGQFVAALHVSQNLNISFDSLKALLTGNDPVSLGQAIHDLKPSLGRSTVRGDVRTAQRETDSDFDRARMDNELAANPSLAAAAQALLPAGTNLQAAVAGFEDIHQFLAAANAAQDLNISFSALKAKMTGSDPESLAQAIKDLDPNLTASTIKTDVRTAEQQAGMDIGAARLENQLATNTTLASLVQGLLPAGTKLQSAAAGFDSDRQFLLTVNLSKDLNISFSQLKADVTGANPMSFEQALSALLPTLSQATIKSDIQTASQQTWSDIQTAFGTSRGEKGDMALGH